MSDLISREYMKSLGATCIASRSKDGNMFPIVSIDELPSVQPTQLTDEDKETIRIHLNAFNTIARAGNAAGNGAIRHTPARPPGVNTLWRLIRMCLISGVSCSSTVRCTRPRTSEEVSKVIMSTSLSIPMKRPWKAGSGTKM